MASSQEERPNLLCCRPVRRVEAEEEEDHVVVLRPRFLRGPLAWWLQPRLKRPHFRVKLDPIGSFIWRHCDGETTVAQLAQDMEQEFGDGAEQAVERKIGARGLRMIMEELMLEMMFSLPSQKGAKEVVVSRDVVMNKSNPLVVMEKAG